MFVVAKCVGILNRIFNEIFMFNDTKFFVIWYLWATKQKKRANNNGVLLLTIKTYETQTEIEPTKGLQQNVMKSLLMK